MQLVDSVYTVDGILRLSSLVDTVLPYVSVAGGCESALNGLVHFSLHLTELPLLHSSCDIKKVQPINKRQFAVPGTGVIQRSRWLAHRREYEGGARICSEGSPVFPRNALPRGSEKSTSRY